MASHGPTRSATIQSTNNVTVTSPQSPAPIPGKNVASLRLTPLP